MSASLIPETEVLDPNLSLTEIKLIPTQQNITQLQTLAHWGFQYTVVEGDNGEIHNALVEEELFKEFSRGYKSKLPN